MVEKDSTGMVAATATYTKINAYSEWLSKCLKNIFKEKIVL